MGSSCTALVVAAALAACSPAAERAASPVTHPPGHRAASPATPAPEVAPSAPARARKLVDPVFVYQLRKGGDAYRRSHYDALPRPSGGARGAGERMQIALDELVAGPTPAERRAGYSSAFSADTADVVLRAELRGRRAVVDFEDFRQDRGGWSTSYGGSQFLMQLSRTIFQFRRVRSILFRIEKSCARFWTFLQAGGCEIMPREGPRTPRP